MQGFKSLLLSCLDFFSPHFPVSPSFHFLFSHIAFWTTFPAPIHWLSTFPFAFLFKSLFFFFDKTYKAFRMPERESSETPKSFAGNQINGSHLSTYSAPSKYKEKHRRTLKCNVAGNKPLLILLLLVSVFWLVKALFEWRRSEKLAQCWCWLELVAKWWNNHPLRTLEVKVISFQVKPGLLSQGVSQQGEILPPAQALLLWWLINLVLP